jgi:site-specific recombinase XerD
LVGLRCDDVELGVGAHVRCRGKGRKDRSTPLRRDVSSMLGAWMRERSGRPEDPLFPTSRGNHLSRDAVERIIRKHAAVARGRCPSLERKKVTPHVLRHTADGTAGGEASTAP